MDIQGYLGVFLGFVNTKIIPFVVAIAFLFFLVNALRYFIIGGGNEDSREKAKSLAIWGIMAFVLIMAFWGFVNIFMNLFGISGGAPITPDYMGGKNP